MEVDVILRSPDFLGNNILDGLNIPFVKGKSRFDIHKKGFKINGSYGNYD